MLGYVVGGGAGAADALLAAVAARLTDAGLQLAGVVQINSGGADGCACDMDLLLLAPGHQMRISQSLGKNATGCRLDADGLERAVAHVEAGLDAANDIETPAADLLVINKFGLQEAMGRGFVPVIAKALAMDLPVVLAVNPNKLAAFLAFAGDLASPLPADLTAICDWVTAQLSPASAC